MCSGFFLEKLLWLQNLAMPQTPVVVNVYNMVSFCNKKVFSSNIYIVIFLSIYATCLV